jgi:hypothetical protein
LRLAGRIITPNDTPNYTQFIKHPRQRLGPGNTISATTSALNNAVYGSNTATSGSGANGGMFLTSSPQGSGIVAQNTGTGGTDYAARLVGNVFVTGKCQ